MNAPKPPSGPSPIPKVNSQRLPVTGGVVSFVFWSPCGFMPLGEFLFQRSVLLVSSAQ